jgi:hypothetical protein
MMMIVDDDDDDGSGCREVLMLLENPAPRGPITGTRDDHHHRHHYHARENDNGHSLLDVTASDKADDVKSPTEPAAGQAGPAKGAMDDDDDDNDSKPSIAWWGKWRDPKVTVWRHCGADTKTAVKTPIKEEPKSAGERPSQDEVEDADGSAIGAW